jgi:REP element-mobilizing transposase RayT
MSQFRKTTPDDTYFITLTLIGWINLFDREDYKRIIVENLQYCQKNENLEIFSYVIMSNHIHLVCRRIDKDLNELLGRFKSFTSKEFLREINTNPKESRSYWLLNVSKHFATLTKQVKDFRLWKTNNQPTLISDNEILDQKINYIHENPVRAGVVTEAPYYKYSSACFDSPLKVMES